MINFIYLFFVYIDTYSIFKEGKGEFCSQEEWPHEVPRSWPLPNCHLHINCRIYPLKVLLHLIVISNNTP